MQRCGNGRVAMCIRARRVVVLNSRRDEVLTLLQMQCGQCRVDPQGIGECGVTVRPDAGVVAQSGYAGGVNEKVRRSKPR